MINPVTVNIHEDGICFVLLNNPPVNALSSDMIRNLTEAFEKIIENKNLKAVIISSTQKHFCAGADLKERSQMDSKETIDTVQNIGNCFQLLTNINIPTICAINGAALGGGAELALCADFRIASESAIIGFPETSIGIIPGAGGTQRLSRLIGVSKSKYWIFSSRKFQAEDAFSDGFVDFLTNDNELLDTALSLASEFVDNSKAAIKLAKKSIDEGDGLNINKALELEFKHYKLTLKNNDRTKALKKYK